MRSASGLSNPCRNLVVVLDADVLFGRTLRDVLLYVAAEGLFQPRWSAEIFDELRRNLVADGWMSDAKAVGLCLNPGAVMSVLRFLETHYKNPPLTLEQLLARLSLDAPQFVTHVRGLLGLQ